MCSFRTDGVVGPADDLSVTDSKGLERPTGAGESPVEAGQRQAAGILSTTRHEKSCGKPGGPPSKAQYVWRPIVNKYREGKVKSTPRGG